MRQNHARLVSFERAPALTQAKNPTSGVPAGSKVEHSPHISLVVATKNVEGTIERCLGSFRSQDYPHKQLIVIDALSTDHTLEIVRKWMEPGDILLSEPDTGIYEAWNKAIPLCSGQWISFLGADDFLPDEYTYRTLAKEISRLDPAIEIVYGKVQLVNTEGQELLTFGKPWSYARKKLRAGGTLPHPGSLHRATLFHRIGNFDERYKIAGDYQLQLRALRGREAHYASAVVVAVHQLGGLSGTEATELASIKEVVRARKSVGIFFPSSKLAVNFAYAWVRLFARKILGEESAHKALDFLRKIIGRDPYWTKT